MTTPDLPPAQGPRPAPGPDAYRSGPDPGIEAAARNWRAYCEDPERDRENAEVYRAGMHPAAAKLDRVVDKWFGNTVGALMAMGLLIVGIYAADAIVRAVLSALAALLP